MAFLIPAGLLIIGLLCCIGIAFLVVQARADERKAVAQKALVATRKTPTTSIAPKTTVIPATPVLPTPPTPPTASSVSPMSPVSPASTDETIGNDASVKKHYPKTTSAQPTQTQEKTPDLPTTEPISEQQEARNDSGKGNGNGHNSHAELQNLQLYAEIEQIAQLIQDDKLSPQWIREQIQELSVKVQDMHQQSALVERHIALLSQIAVYMNELEQVRHEYKVLREKRGAVLRIPTHLHGEGEDGDTYIHTDKRPAMRKYTLKTM